MLKVQVAYSSKTMIGLSLLAKLWPRWRKLPWAAGVKRVFPRCDGRPNGSGLVPGSAARQYVPALACPSFGMRLPYTMYHTTLINDKVRINGCSFLLLKWYSNDSLRSIITLHIDVYCVLLHVLISHCSC